MNDGIMVGLVGNGSSYCPSDKGVTSMGDAASPELVPTLPPGLPDDWVLDRDLLCPKCRYNLRMLCLPRCPECGTVFRWQALLHIGCPRCGESLEATEADRCPGCRLELDWTRLLQEADPEQFRQFEHTRRPVRAASRAWLGALRPRRFWRNIRLESPPVVTRLRWLRRAAFVVCVLGLLAIAGAQRPRLLGGPGIEEWMAGWAVVLVLPVVTMIGLPLFTPTLARCRVRREQLLRCCAYAGAGMAWIGFVLLLVAVVLFLVNTLWTITRTTGGSGPFIVPRVWVFPSDGLEYVIGGPFFRPWIPTEVACLNLVVTAVVLYLSFVWWWRFVWVSLRYYLRLNWPNAVALFLSTQIVGVLVLLLILLQWWPFATRLGHMLEAF